jgi:hypothetical protein
MHEIDAAKPGSKLDKSTVDKQVEEIQDVLKQFNFVTKHGSEGQSTFDIILTGTPVYLNFRAFIC